MPVDQFDLSKVVGKLSATQQGSNSLAGAFYESLQLENTTSMLEIRQYFHLTYFITVHLNNLLLVIAQHISLANVNFSKFPRNINASMHEVFIECIINGVIIYDNICYGQLKLKFTLVIKIVSIIISIEIKRKGITTTETSIIKLNDFY